ncbi:MAG: hemerythrin family protein [Candidatus Kapabacteria bacterium]|nr:hemerythrin family protein [Ignavibacteriota bacterium]MCW5884730.1 hemerythrin family protein [Candidatus Kapabacteria bacterium]
MALISWNNSLSVNVTKFDDQHKVLVNLINDLHEAMMNGKGKLVIGKILQDLTSYSESHFAEEEKYFAQYSYPKTVTHIKEHRDFINKVIDFRQGYDSGKLSISVEVINFLKTWLQNHINVVDKEYSDFFNSKGLK